MEHEHYHEPFMIIKNATVILSRCACGDLEITWTQQDNTEYLDSDKMQKQLEDWKNKK